MGAGRVARVVIRVALASLAVYDAINGCVSPTNDAPGPRPSALDVICAHSAFARVCRDRQLRLDAGRYAVDGRSAAHGPLHAPLHATAAADATGTIRIESVRSPGVWIELQPIGRRAAAGEATRGAVAYADAEPNADVVVALANDSLEDLRVLWSPEAAGVERYQVTLGPDAKDIEVHPSGVRIFDRQGRIALRSLPPLALDARDQRRGTCQRV